MIVTTGHKPPADVIEEAERWQHFLHLPLVQRRNDGIATLYKKYNCNKILIISREQPKLYIKENPLPFFFHPGLAVLRIKRLLKGDTDLLVQVAELKEGDSFLDCTLGLAGDGIIASFIVGENGRVVGVESEEIVAILTREGLAKWEEPIDGFNESLRRIEVVASDHYTYLQAQPDDAFDVVYFDPMFRKGVTESVGIASLRDIANHQPIERKAIEEALRVCRRKVIMKERSDSDEFTRLGFTKIYRGSASITFGVIEK